MESSHNYENNQHTTQVIAHFTPTGDKHKCLLLDSLKSKSVILEHMSGEITESNVPNKLIENLTLMIGPACGAQS